MEELEESIIREHNYDEYQARIVKVKKNFSVAWGYNFVFNIVVFAVSLAYIYLWLSFTNAGIKQSLRLEEEIGIIYFPGFAVTLFFTPALAVMSYFCDIFFIKKLNRICQVIYLIILLFAVSNLVIRFEPMKISHLIGLIAYSVFGLWTEDFAVRSYGELEFLSTREGFPDFNYALEAERHSKYVKYRERWLKKSKKLDYYTDSERPVTEYTVVAAEKENAMDGVSLESEKCSQWFEGKNTDKSSSQGVEMDPLEIDGVDVSELPDESEYIIDDVRKRPL